MGCDVHLYTEIYAKKELYKSPMGKVRLRDEVINEILDEELIEKWVSADKWHCDVYDEGEEFEYVDWDNEPYYRGRNYYLFNILGGVRDYNDSVKQIAPLRGVPDDASDSYKFMVEQWHGDGHSHSYYTLEELLNVNWDLYETSNIKSFLDTIEKLKTLGEPSKVRILFFFDN